MMIKHSTSVRWVQLSVRSAFTNSISAAMLVL